MFPDGDLDVDPGHNFSDITLSCGSMDLHCHKVILAARSQEFRKIFSDSGFELRQFFKQHKYKVKLIDPEILLVRT